MAANSVHRLQPAPALTKELQFLRPEYQEGFEQGVIAAALLIRRHAGFIRQTQSTRGYSGERARTESMLMRLARKIERMKR